jgi:hypothetical protein
MRPTAADRDRGRLEFDPRRPVAHQRVREQQRRADGADQEQESREILPAPSLRRVTQPGTSIQDRDHDRWCEYARVDPGGDLDGCRGPGDGSRRAV